MRIVKIPLINYPEQEAKHERIVSTDSIITKPAPSPEVSEKVMTKEEHQRKVNELIDKVRKEAYEAAKTHFDAEKEEWTKDKPKDWEFMVQSGKTLKNLPPTWMSYPDTPEGMVGIIEMEYGEVMAAWKDKLGTEAVSHELVHLASACLHMWRRLNHAE